MSALSSRATDAIGRRLLRLLVPTLVLVGTLWIGIPSAARRRALGVGPEAAGGRASDLDAVALDSPTPGDGLPEDWEAAMWPMQNMPDVGAGTSAPTTWTKRDGPEWVAFPAGTFTMGDAAVPGAGPARSVALAAFELQRTEFTWRQLDAVCTRSRGGRERLPEGLCDLPRPNDTTLPVVGVTRSDAAAICAAIDARLPTEAEWERAARGTAGRRHPWGDEFDSGRAITVLRMTDRPLRSHEDWLAFSRDAKEQGRAPVLAPAAAAVGDQTPEGVMHLHGNVMEWVGGAWSPARGAILTDGNGGSLPGANDRLGVVRGVSAISRDFAAPSAARFPLPLEWRAENLGLRCAQSRPAW